MIFVAGLRPGHVFQFWNKKQNLESPETDGDWGDACTQSLWGYLQGTHGMPPFQMPYLLLAFGNLSHSISFSVFKAQDFNQSPVFF